jgi:hypothetical protein
MRGLEWEIERGRPELGEPEAELLHEVEGEAIRAGRARRDDRGFDLQFAARLDHLRERDAVPVPDDRVAERIEPVVRELHALSPARAPRRRPCVLQAQACSRRHTRALLGELVREPPHRERPGRHRMLSHALHGALL